MPYDENATGRRDNDLVLNQNEYVYISDQNTGLISTIVGPKKETLQNTDQPMLFDIRTEKFGKCSLSAAICQFVKADITSYIILENPSEEHAVYPSVATMNKAIELEHGCKINIEGPANFALWPGQKARVIAGHRLKYNQYLLVRIVNGTLAEANKDKMIMTDTDGAEADTSSLSFVTGALNIIKGTDVSFYMPPTGMEVVADGPETQHKWVRNALTLERLQYCILVDENGTRRYVKGPDVVFPNPTETFVTQGDEKRYKAIELNPNMGIHVKVSAAYTDGDKTYEIGDEIFITGKDQKIYYPRVEHVSVKYDGESIHYAVAIPKGEAIYVLNKDSGAVDTIKGNNMLLPNPINQVVVKRVLTDRHVELWFPGNKEALVYNQTLSAEMDDSGYIPERPTSRVTGAHARMISKMSTDSAFGAMARAAVDDSFENGMDRKTTYTPPRTITLDTKYRGAVLINIWPGYAIQVVSKEGDRTVIEGPKAVILDYDQILECLTLSTGRPKNDSRTQRTAYLKTKNNKVSDRITVKTSDLVDVSIDVSFKVNFENDPTKWFEIEDYIKHLTENCRSILRNVLKKSGVNEIRSNGEDLIRDCILGKSVEGSRPGRKFPENGMHIYDVDILDIRLSDSEIDEMIVEQQHDAVRNELSVTAKQAELETAKKIAEANKQINSINAEMATLKYNNDTLERKRYYDDKLEREVRNQEIVTKEIEIKELNFAQTLAEATKEVDLSKVKIALQTEAFKTKMESFSPQLIAALKALGENELTSALVNNLPVADQETVRLILGGNTSELLNKVNGTKLFNEVKTITND